MMTAPPKMLPSSSSRGFVPPPQLLFSPLYTSRVKKRLAMGTEDVATQPRQKSSSSSLSALLNCYSSALCWVFPPPSLGGRGGSSSSFSLDGKTFATAAEEEEEGELESQDIYFSSSFVFVLVVAVSPLSPARRGLTPFSCGVAVAATDETVSLSLYSLLIRRRGQRKTPPSQVCRLLSFQLFVSPLMTLNASSSTVLPRFIILARLNPFWLACKKEGGRSERN